MDEEQIEIKDEFLHQHKELQFENNSIAASAIENTNFLNEEVHIKRLCLVKTTSWQHRFFDLTILSPMWLGT